VALEAYAALFFGLHKLSHEQWVQKKVCSTVLAYIRIVEREGEDALFVLT